MADVNMTRRGAMLAAMAAIGGAFSKAYGQALTHGYGPVIWDIPEVQVDPLAGMGDCKATGAFTCFSFSAYHIPKPVEYALIVRYKGREVKITPDELMDALEGK